MGDMGTVYRCFSAFLIRVVTISYTAVVSPVILVDTVNANLPGMHPNELGTCDFRSSHSAKSVMKECSAVLLFQRDASEHVLPVWHCRLTVVADDLCLATISSGDQIFEILKWWWNLTFCHSSTTLQCRIARGRTQQFRNLGNVVATMWKDQTAHEINSLKILVGLWLRGTQIGCWNRETEWSATLLFNSTQVKKSYEAIVTSCQVQCSAVIPFSNLFHRHLLPTHVDCGMKFSSCRFKPSLEKANLAHSP